MQIYLSPFLSAALKASRGLSFWRSMALSSFLMSALQAFSLGTTTALAVAGLAFFFLASVAGFRPELGIALPTD